MFILAILGLFLLISCFIVFWIANVAKHVTCELAWYYTVSFVLTFLLLFWV